MCLLTCLQTILREKSHCRLTPILSTAQTHKHKSTETTCHVPSVYHTLILQEGYPHSPLSQRGVPQLRPPPLPPGYFLWRFLVRGMSEALWRYQKKWQSKGAASISHRRCLSRATLMWWLLFALWCGGAVRLVGLSRLCLLVCWAWQSLWWSSD